MRKINLTLTAVLAVLAFVFTLGAGPIHAQGRENLSFPMPACPIKAHTVAPTKTEITLPDENPLGGTLSIAGAVQVTDQSGATVSLTAYGDVLSNSPGVVVDDTHVFYARTVKTISHATGSVSFDKGCTATDAYGSNKCTWDWGQSITVADQGALQEDITSGKLVVDLKVNNITPVQFTCRVCGATCKLTIPEQQQQNQQQWGEIWALMTQTVFRFPLFLIIPNLFTISDNQGDDNAQ